MRIRLGSTTLEIRCSSCGQSAAHEITYASEPVHHLRCGECRAVDAYVLDVLEEPGASGKTRKYAKVNAVLQDHAALMHHRGSQELHAYHTTGTYVNGQYIAHSKYGDGYILNVLGPPMKMEVLFADKKRLHVCGSGSTSSVSLATARKMQRSKPAKQRKSEKAPRRNRPRRSKEGGNNGPSRAEPMKCPVCGHIVHPFNLLRNVNKLVVGCMHCR